MNKPTTAADVFAPPPPEPYDDVPPEPYGGVPPDPYDDVPPPHQGGPPREGTEDPGPLDVISPPTLTSGALQGRAGHIVRTLAPYTEADPAALLVTLLAWFGAVIDRGPHMLVSNDEHPARVWPLIVGRTSGGAKGTSLSVIRRLMLATDRTFSENMATGLTSGEGLIEYIRDPTADLDPDAAGFDEGVADKRLLAVETEFAATLARGRRETSTLLPVLRDAWDGTPLQTMSRKKNALRATGYHVVLIGHISPSELVRSLRETDLAGGTLNRFLLVHSRRSKSLPEGGNVPDEVVDALAAEVSTALTAAGTRRYHRDETATALWTDIYTELTVEGDDDWFAAATARGPVQVLRLSLAYALLDGAPCVQASHLTAAFELWKYCEETAGWLFTTAADAAESKHRARLLEFIAGYGPDGASRTEIRVQLYQRNKSAAAIDALLGPLLHEGRIRDSTVKGRGRAATRYSITNREE